MEGIIAEPIRKCYLKKRAKSQKSVSRTEKTAVRQISTAKNGAFALAQRKRLLYNILSERTPWKKEASGMDNRPIGVFDSGLGGLTAVKALRRLLPGEDLIYFGDTARVPYGGRSRETLLKYARQDIAFLRSFDLKAVLIACGTVTSTSLDTLRKENDLPVLGVVEPSCREALAVTKNKKIGMIATLASARSGAYERTLKGLDADVRVVSQPCPLFVPLVENGRFRQGDVVIETVAREYLTPLMEAGVDTLILGCTHYPLLKDIIGEICGPGVTLIDSGAASARALRQQLAAEGQLTDRQQGETRFYVSDRPEDFEKLAAVFLEEPLSRGAERIDIEQY